MMNKRPEENEYAEFYAGYVSLVGETDVLSALQNQIAECRDLFSTISEEKSLYAYAPDKWTIRELVGHLTDAERVFAYRALRFSRRDETPLSPFDQDTFVAKSRFNETSFADLVSEFLFQRESNLLMFKNLAEEDWSNFGTASNNQITVRALAYIMVGHVRHHLKILRERYLDF